MKGLSNSLPRSAGAADLFRRLAMIILLFEPTAVAQANENAAEPVVLVTPLENQSVIRQKTGCKVTHAKWRRRNHARIHS